MRRTGLRDRCPDVHFLQSSEHRRRGVSGNRHDRPRGRSASYGFLTAQEKSVFRQLLKVSGIGPRISLAMLSSMSAEDIGNAIANNEVGLLTMVPGIGKKTAERLVLELKDKMVVTSVPTVSSVQTEVIQALVALGFSEREARGAAKNVPADADASEGIRLCLRQLAQKG